MDWKTRRQIYRSAAARIECAEEVWSCLAVQSAAFRAGLDADKAGKAWLRRIQRFLGNRCYSALTFACHREKVPQSCYAPKLARLRIDLLRAAAQKKSLRRVWERFVADRKGALHVQSN